MGCFTSFVIFGLVLINCFVYFVAIVNLLVEVLVSDACFGFVRDLYFV